MTTQINDNTRLIFTDTPMSGSIKTTWAEFCVANVDCPEDIEDAREQITKRGHALLGGGAAPEFRLALPLPKGWTWECVEAERAKYGISPNMIPIASASGCVAWGTINSALWTKS